MTPDLGDLLQNPDRVREIPDEVIPIMFVQVAALGCLLASRLITRTSDSTAAESNESTGSDRLLTADEAAERLGVTVRWLYRRKLPFARRLSRKALRFSERGLERWLANRRSA
jgi:predicted DNA-binding transcriptional regulator AlpA